jgi:hypothetical protein
MARKIHPKYFPIKAPKIDDRNKVQWDGIEIRSAGEKGLGVFATKDLKPGLSFPFGGVKISQREGINLRSHSGRNNFSDYLAEISLGFFGRVTDNILRENSEISFIDGHLRRMNKADPEGSWIGAFCNEPSFNERANAELGLIDFKGVKVPIYPATEHEFPLFINIEEQIKKGEEILVCYYYSKPCYRRLGYLRGPDVNEAVIIPPRVRLLEDAAQIEKLSLRQEIQRYNARCSNQIRLMKKRKNSEQLKRFGKQTVVKQNRLNK